MMVTLGTDAHKRSHTVVATDDVGAELGSVTGGATTEGHLRLVKWAAQFEQRRWAIEDCRALSRRLEADLLTAGEQVTRVPPKLMAGTQVVQLLASEIKSRGKAGIMVTHDLRMVEYTDRTSRSWTVSFNRIHRSDAGRRVASHAKASRRESGFAGMG